MISWEREVNHIATGRALGPGGRTTPSSSSEVATVIKMAVRSMETAEMVMETDGDGSGGTSPSRQGVGI
jgi:hypothetical protein